MELLIKEEQLKMAIQDTIIATQKAKIATLELKVARIKSFSLSIDELRKLPNSDDIDKHIIGLEKEMLLFILMR